MGDLTMDVLKQMATEQSFLKGQDYYEGDAIMDPVFDNGILKGEVAGNYEYYYDVRLSTRKPYKAHCTCPYDWGGVCKHVIALGLAWLHQPETFMKNKGYEKHFEIELNTIMVLMEKADLMDFLSSLISEDHAIKLKFLSFLETEGQIPVALAEETLRTLMAEAQTLMEECNACDGKTEKREQGHAYFHAMKEILEGDEWISQQLRQEIIDVCIRELTKGNSSFDTALLHTIQAAAKSKEDWELIMTSSEKAECASVKKGLMEIYGKRLDDG